MSYTHLTIEERYYIEKRIANVSGISNRQLARELGRSHTTIGLELRRNMDSGFGFYSGLRANNLHKSRKSKASLKPNKIIKLKDKIKQYIYAQLSIKTSPEQICGRIKVKHKVRVSFMTLYRHIEKDKANGGILFKNLCYKYKKPRKIKKGNDNTIIKNKVNIAKRPAIANDKKEPGHWEIDTIFGLDQKSYLLTLTDKASKYEVIAKLANKQAQTVLSAIEYIVSCSLLPFKTITSDNGTEFAYHQEIAKITNSSFYFANTYSSWERGLNEHQNGLIRKFLPKKTDFRNVSGNTITNIQNNLNNRPRKSLGFLTPAEVMFQYVTHGKLVHLTC